MSKMETIAFPGVMIAIVNWNRYQDTLTCLESLRKLDYPNFFIVVCDNGSKDGSVEQLRLWAETENVSFQSVSDKDAALLSAEIPQCCALTCIAGSSNHGFAGANNWALKYALRMNFVQYVWLLNNDTVVDPGALREMVQVVTQNADIGLCGSTVLQMDRPNTVQCLGGGRYSFWTGRTRHVGDGREWNSLASKENLRAQVETQINFVYGASMLVSCDFLQDVGMMSEDYFLYFEELDWAERARGRYKMSYAPGSLVWHKEGASTLLADRKKSEAADYYMIRNRVLFTSRYFPFGLVTVFAGLLVSLGKRIFRGQFGRIPLLLHAIADGMKVAHK